MSKSPLPRIFICDDDPGIVDVVSLVFEEKLEVVGLTQPQSAQAVLTEIKRNLPHLVLLDLWMPPVSGVEVINAMQTVAELKHIPVIVISASKDLTQAATQLSVTNFLSKPFDIAELEQVVYQALPN